MTCTRDLKLGQGAVRPIKERRSSSGFGETSLKKVRQARPKQLLLVRTVERFANMTRSWASPRAAKKALLHAAQN